MTKSKQLGKPYNKDLTNISARYGKSMVMLSYACAIAKTGKRVHFHTLTQIGKDLTTTDVAKAMGNCAWPIGLRIIGPRERGERR